VGLGQVSRGGPDPRRAGILARDLKGLIQRVAVPAVTAGLPPVKPELPEPGQEVAPPSSLPHSSSLLQDRPFHRGQGKEEELAARGHQGQEDGLLQGSAWAKAL